VYVLSFSLSHTQKHAHLLSSPSRSQVPTWEDLSAADSNEVEAVIIGGGIMSTIVAAVLKRLQPAWKVRQLPQHDRIAKEVRHNDGIGPLLAALLVYKDTRENPTRITRINAYILSVPSPLAASALLLEL